jgi:hypothetical protein
MVVAVAVGFEELHHGLLVGVLLVVYGDDST